MIKSFAKVTSQDRVVNQLQDNLGNAISSLINVPLNQGILLTNIFLVTGTNNIYTTLARPLVGWLKADQDAAADIYREPSDDANVLVLNSSADVTVSLFVF